MVMVLESGIDVVFVWWCLVVTRSVMLVWRESCVM